MKQLKKGFFTFWIENYKVSFLFLFLIIVVGLLSIISIPKESTPDIKFGIIVINTSYSGVNPQDIDSLITEKIEKEIEDIEGINTIKSDSFVGMSSVVVELYNGVSTRDVMTDIKDRLDTISFPTDADDSIVKEISTRNELLFEALIYSDREFDTFHLTQKARELQSALEGKDGIASIDIGGGGVGIDGGSSDAPDYELQVLISKEKLELFNLNIAGIANILRSSNRNTPLGNFTIGSLNYDFRFDGEFNSLGDLENTIISGQGTSSIRLKDIASIQKKYTNDTIQSLGFYNEKGYNYVNVSFNKKQGDSIFKVSKAAKKSLESFLEDTPGFEDMHVKYSQDLGADIIDDYRNLGKTALQTFVLVFLTIFIFVGIRESVIASILLPLAFFITFIVLNSMGLSLNFLTNFSLVLTLGIAIDTIIVIIEGAAERQRLGYSRKNAIIIAVYDLKSPLISGTATTLVAFLPMIFLPGIMGKFLSYIPITVFVTLFAALVLSLTLATALFYKISKKKTFYHKDADIEESLSRKEAEFLEKQRQGKKELSLDHLSIRDKFLDAIGEKYYKLLYKFLQSKKSRLLAISVPFILLILSFVFLSPKIGFTLFPASDEGVIQVTVKGQAGADEKSLEKYIQGIEEILSSYEEMSVYYVKLSGRTIYVYMELTDAKLRQRLGQRSVFDMETQVLERLGFLNSQGLLIEVAALENGPPTGSPVGIKLHVRNSQSIEKLKKVAGDFKAFLQGVEGTKNVSTSSNDTPGQFEFHFDLQKLSYVGLTPDEILSELRFYVAGISAGSIQSAYEDNDIILSLAEFENTLSPKDIMNLQISTRVGKIRIGDYADYSFDPGLSSISRRDGKITIQTNADLETGALPSEIQPKLIDFAEKYNFPDGVSYSAGGENEENSELISSTLQSFFIALFLIFTILVFQFNSYSQPIIILYSVVLALLGVNLGLFITGNPYSMTFGIGFIALTGIVVNDAIILVDRINRNLDRLVRNSGDKILELDDYVQSLVAAGRSRLQPIIVTTLTTLFGVLPLALQDAFWAGLGYTIIFGLFAGSFMTLFVIPALYYTIYLKKKMKK